jgi:hypothetical protein
MDPKTKYPNPPFPPQKQKPHGKESKMVPKPDYGENSYRGSGKLKGKTALITGADSGIGRAVAFAFSREGASVAIAYYSSDSDAKETLAAVKGSATASFLLKGDVSQESFCKEAVEKTISELGKIDILVNNAAIQKTYEDVVHIPASDIDLTFRTNIYSMFYLSRATIPHMKPGSAIINTASIQAYKPSPQLLPYAVTKGAIVTFTKGLAHAVADRGIRVNAVAPGPVWTPLIPSSFDEEKNTKFGGNVPLGRAGQPAELAPVYVLLASPEGSYITGQVYGVTGGEFLI